MKKMFLAGALLAFMPSIAFAQTSQEATNSNDTTVGQESVSQAIVGGTTFNSENDQVASTAVAASQVVNGNWVCSGLGFSGAAQTDVAGISVNIGGRDRGCEWLREIIAVRAGNTPLERAGAAVRACRGNREVQEDYELIGYTCRDVGVWVFNYAMQQTTQQPAAFVAPRAPAPAPTPARAEEPPRERVNQRTAEIADVRTAVVAGATQ